MANLTDFGEYACIVKNDYGNVSTFFSVHIWGKYLIDASAIYEIGIVNIPSHLVIYEMLQNFNRFTNFH